ncbi:MAG TPA: GNAT family N-acetyltransferase [Phototrophicaceae bacterium]|nr:GNAT family N-acetyltransferase [Phototrophicaceae bacterium]
MTLLPVFQSPDPNLLVRPVRLTDAEPLHARCWPQRSFMTVYNMLTRALQYAKDERGLGVVVVDAAGAVQGYGQMAVWPSCAEVSDLVVAEAYRSQGCGTAMIQHLVRAAYRLGTPAVEIGAAVSNTRAIRLYQRLGFEDSHTLTLNLGSGQEPVLFLRLELQNVKFG